MSNDITHASIEILGKVYQIKCPLEEVQALQRAAKYLEERMRIMRDTGVLSADRVLLITALNVVNQLLTLEKQNHNDVELIHQRLQSLHLKVDHVLMQTSEPLNL